MTTVKHYTGRVGGGYSGSVKGNMQAIENDAFSAAVKQIFAEMCKQPDTAWCSIQGLSQTNSTHGMARSYNGQHVLKMVEGSFHAHTDHDKLGNFKNWQGSATYDYDFGIEEHAV